MAELVVAMLIISIALLVLMMVQTSALVTIAEAGKRQQATAYGNEAMEQLRAMPWNVLKKGMANNFISASGDGPPRVEGGVLTLEDISETLFIAPPFGSAGAQDTTDPWQPLFDEHGSNLQTMYAPGDTGVEYQVRTYIVHGLGGEGTIGLVVSVRWLNTDSGETGEQVLRSTAYASSENGGCGKLDEQPFLSSCEARLDSAAGSGNLVVSVSSSQQLTPADPVTPYPIVPNDPANVNAVYQMNLRTSETRATMSSQQITLIEATGAYGGLKSTGTGGGVLSEVGYTTYGVLASNSPSEEPPATVTATFHAPGVTHLPSPVIPGFSIQFKPDADADGGRAGTARAEGKETCGITGIPAGQPCAKATMGGNIETNVMWDFGMGDPPYSKNQLYAIRRLGESGTTSSAWAARFVSPVGGIPATGCTMVTGTGCAAASARQDSDTIRFGFPGGDSNALPWVSPLGSGATDGIVYITGYSDEVTVERGPSQMAAGTVKLDRGGTLYYWNGTQYIGVPLHWDFSHNYDSTDIPDLTWTNGNSKVSITASTTVVISPAQKVLDGDSACKDDVCRITATAGSISVQITYTITVPESGLVYTTTVTGTINGSTAIASYKEAPPGG